jgi:hypothetical protein
MEAGASKPTRLFMVRTPCFLVEAHTLWQTVPLRSSSLAPAGPAAVKGQGSASGKGQSRTLTKKTHGPRHAARWRRERQNACPGTCR